MTPSSRKILLMAAQHEVKEAKERYRAGKISLEAVKAVHKAMEGMQVQIDIEYKKNNN